MVLSLALPGFSKQPNKSTPQADSTSTSTPAPTPTAVQAGASTASLSAESNDTTTNISSSSSSDTKRSSSSTTPTPKTEPSASTSTSTSTSTSAPNPPSNTSSTLIEALRGNPFGLSTRASKAPSSSSTTATAINNTSINNVEDEKERERQELNDALATLIQLFPDVKVEVFRELLVRFDGRSRLQVCVEQLLRNRAEWVKGRWNVPEEGEKGKREKGGSTGIRNGNGNGDIPTEELFKSQEYKSAVKSTLAMEFRALSRSTIDAVLAEVNFSYTRARPTLRELSRKSWRVTIGNMFQFKKKRPEGDHPLLVWQRATEGGQQVPKLKETGCLELDRELHEAFLAPLLAKRKEEQEDGDLLMAEELNKAEAEAVEAIFECDCCLSDVTFEQISTCSVGSHIICFTCIQRTTHEALFGQGWGKSIDHTKSTLRCLAPLAEGTCEGTLDSLIVKRAILAEKAGAETYAKFEDRLASECLLKSQYQLIRCPFCSYAEIDPVYHPDAKGLSWRFRRGNLIPTIVTVILLLDMIPLLILPFCYFLLFCPAMVTTILTTSLRNVCLKTRTQRFRCSNPSCGRDSCITCHKPWQDVHLCHEPLLLSLRTTVEAARTAAIKRTCPQCGLSFVKSSGCNKLTCVCGYSMCYICRKALGPIGPRINAVRRPAPRRMIQNNNNNNNHNNNNNNENLPFPEHQADGDNPDLLANEAYDDPNNLPLPPVFPDNDPDNDEPEGYRHFCEHFRINPGTRCSECTKCDLYLAEDEEAVARRAGERAERQWRVRQGLLNSNNNNPASVLGTAGVNAHGVEELRVKLNEIASGGGRGYGYRGGYYRDRGGYGGGSYGYGGVTGPWDRDWSSSFDADGWKGWWQFWMWEVWRDGRWKGEGQGFVDWVVERVVVVQV
ncbi:hypothetical protein FQN52_008394 [Onygenales sp. PD_12]|nr:hypothetical protein FQN52_008394 [Onygenales sp. PD_12]